MHPESGYGLWTIAIVNSVVFIAFAFSFAKPLTRTDWRSFGAFSAFIVALFAVSLVLRAGGDRDYVVAGLGAMFPGWIAVGMAVVSGWLGGELVERLGIGVHEGAHPDAPSSLGGGRRSTA